MPPMLVCFETSYRSRLSLVRLVSNDLARIKIKTNSFSQKVYLHNIYSSINISDFYSIIIIRINSVDGESKWKVKAMSAEWY